MLHEWLIIGLLSMRVDACTAPAGFASGQRTGSCTSRVSHSEADATMAYVRVQCYSGVKADERPVRFELDGREYLVEEILDQWYGPDDTFFKVLADDGNVYILRHSPAQDAWSLESSGSCPDPRVKWSRSGRLNRD